MFLYYVCICQLHFWHWKFFKKTNFNNILIWKEACMPKATRIRKCFWGGGGGGSRGWEYKIKVRSRQKSLRTKGLGT